MKLQCLLPTHPSGAGRYGWSVPSLDWAPDQDACTGSAKSEVSEGRVSPCVR